MGRATGGKGIVTTADDSRERLRIFAGLVSWYLAVYVFLPLPVVRPGLDESWRAFLTWAFEHGRQFGTEVVFTYGPWGFLLEPRGTVTAYRWQILGRLVLALAASCGVSLFAVRWLGRPWQRWAWAAAFAFWAEPSTLSTVLLFAAVPSALDVRRHRISLLLLSVAAGLAACTKFTCFVLVFALLPVLLVRRLVPVAAAIAGSSLFFWTLAGQSLGHLPAYIIRSWQISSGYSSAMVDGRPWIELVLALLICIPPLVQWTRQTAPSLSWERLSGIVWLALCEYLVFRHGLIRSDPYHFYVAFLAVGIPIALLLLPAVLSSPASSWKTAYPILLAAALGATLWAAHVEIRHRGKLFVESVRLYPLYARTLSVRSQSANSSAGSIDIFPSELSYAVANGLPLRNRPVIQAYSAYTEDLCRRNAEFLEGSGAPDAVYFDSAGPLDGHYPTLEDSLAWRSLLTHYSPSSIADDNLVLRRRERPLFWQLNPILTRTLQTDEFLDIPVTPKGLIWAEIRVHRSVPGRILDLVYRKEKMSLRVDFGRRSHDFTLLDETAAAGFLLSPYIGDTLSLLDLYRSEPQRLAPVRKIAVHRGLLQSVGFTRTVDVRLYELVIGFPPVKFPGSLVSNLARTIRTERSLASPAFSPELRFAGGEFRMLAGAPSEGSIEVPDGEKLRFRFGMDGRADCRGSVMFQVLMGTARGERRTLWKHRSAFESGQAWTGEGMLNIPTPSQGELLYFSIDSADKACAAEGAYWADLTQ